jgi:triphosphatase
MCAAAPPFEAELMFLVSRDGVARVVDNAVPAGTAAQVACGAGAGGEDFGVVAIDFSQGMSRTLFFRASSFEAEHAGRRKSTSKRATAKAGTTAIPKGSTAIAGFVQVVDSCLLQIATNANLLHGVRNPEVVHQIRVGLRRLRAAFATFKPILPPDGLDRLERETEWLSAELEPARDLDVFIKNEFASAQGRVPSDLVMTAFGDRLHVAQDLAYDQALAAVDSDRFMAFVRCCTDWVAVESTRRADNSNVTRLRDGDASLLAARALRRLRRQVCKMGKHLDTLDRVGRHEVRIKAKKLRYAGEFFSKSFGKGARNQRLKFIASLAALQDALGDLNDMATARRSALAVAGRSPELCFRAGLVVGGRDRDEPRLLAKAVQAYRRWAEAKPFWN